MRLFNLQLVILVGFTVSCGDSQFTTGSATQSQLSSVGSIPNENSDIEIQETVDEVEELIDSEESDQVEITEEEVLEIFTSGKVWNYSWNTDRYEEGPCLILVDGLAVVPEDCQSKVPVICEIECQAKATDPVQCQQQTFKFYGTKDEKTYKEAFEYCKERKLVMFEYNSQKVEQFVSDLENKMK